ncbi:phage protein [Salmonella enterica]|nr:phage protein [Salmonella enterica]
MNNKLTDERPDDESLEFLITIRREIAERHASEGRMGQCAVHTLILNALLELQKLRKADSAEPAGYHVIKECGKVGCSVTTLEEAEKTRDFWNKRWTIRPYFYTQPALVATGATNSPVTPDGWISCSERMPEDEQEVIVQNKLGYRYVSYFDEHSGLFFDMRGGNQINCIEHILVTHWRPMSVPPQH